MSSGSPRSLSGAWRGKTLLAKFGGAALSEDAVLARVCAELAEFGQSGARMIVVHGGGSQIAAQIAREGGEPRMSGGLRVTDERTLAVVVQVLCGTVNKRIVAALSRAGCAAVGLSGIDGGMIRAKPRGGGYGLVGEVERIDCKALDAISAQGYVPVVAPLALDSGAGILNVNADEVAVAVAGALGIDAMLMLTGAAGVLDGHGELIGELSPTEADRLIADGTISDGMIPKVRSAIAALDAGVGECKILDCAAERALHRALAGTCGIGTAIISKGEE